MKYLIAIVVVLIGIGIYAIVKMTPGKIETTPVRYTTENEVKDLKDKASDWPGTPEDAKL